MQICLHLYSTYCRVAFVLILPAIGFNFSLKALRVATVRTSCNLACNVLIVWKTPAAFRCHIMPLWLPKRFSGRLVSCLGELLEHQSGVQLAETDKFKRGDRVQVCLDPDVFKMMQDDNRFGGWNDHMALVG